MQEIIIVALIGLAAAAAVLFVAAPLLYLYDRRVHNISKKITE